MKKHNISPKVSLIGGQDKCREIRIEVEPYFINMVLVGVWEDETEHAAFVCPIAIWKKSEERDALLSNVLSDSGLGGSFKWKK